MTQDKRVRARGLVCAVWMACGACGSEAAPESSDDGLLSPSQRQLEQRAYIVSEHSEELTVIDLDKLEIIGRVPTGGVGNHMAELTGDFTQILVTSSGTDEGIVVDTKRLTVQGSIPLTGHPTHISRTPD